MEIKRVTLLITENCNLDCSYCYQHNKQIKKMDFPTAKRIIDETYYLDDYDEGVIHLFGGEPFFNFDLMKKIDDYVSLNYSRITFEVITNGTLIHGDVKTWLSERRSRYNIILSLDGDEGVHNLNRKYRNGEGSFSKIDLDFFIQNWENCSARMTIWNSTLFAFADSVIWIENKGFACKAMFAMGVKWDLEDKKGIIDEQYKKLIDYYTKNYDAELCLFLKYNLDDIYIETQKEEKTCCISDNPCYDTSGIRYYCTCFSPVSIGDISEKFINYPMSCFADTSDNICLKCRLLILCKRVKLCYGSNYQATGNIHRISAEQCFINRMCIGASMDIQENRLKIKYANGKLSEKKFHKDLETIQLIRKYLKNIENGLLIKR